MWFIKQIHNPEKHELMPDDYPWIESTDSGGPNWIEIADIEAYKISFDLTAYNNATCADVVLVRQQEQREFGASMIGDFIDRMGHRNLHLIQQGTSVDISSLLNANAGVKLLIETGALKTARTSCEQLKTVYPSHQDIYQDAINSITAFLVERGYE